MHAKQKFLFQIIICTLIFFFAWLYLISIYQQEINLTQNNLLKQTSLHRDIIIDKYEKMADFYYNTILNNEIVTNIVFNALNATSEKEQGEYRHQLINLITPTYNLLKYMGFRQLHFHFSDNTSFLRMHRPEKFGDDLSHVRETVRLCNERKSFINGFEEGRIFNGYRFVYPLFKGETHVGSVEVSISYNSIGTGLQNIGYRNFFLMMKKGTVQNKVFETELSNYGRCTLSPHYLVDKGARGEDMEKGEYYNNLLVILKEKVSHQIASQKSFTKMVRRKYNIMVVFLSVNNIFGDHSGYFVTFMDEPRLALLKKQLIIKLSFLVFFQAMAYFILYLYYKKLKKIYELQKFLPICANCKKIRKKDADPYQQSSWMPIEEYFKIQTDSVLSHGICPQCNQDLYGDFLSQKKQRNNFSNSN